MTNQTHNPRFDALTELGRTIGEVWGLNPSTPRIQIERAGAMKLPASPDQWYVDHEEGDPLFPLEATAFYLLNLPSDSRRAIAYEAWVQVSRLVGINAFDALADRIRMGDIRCEAAFVIGFAQGARVEIEEPWRVQGPRPFPV